MDTELVLNVAHVDTAVALVVDEHRESTSVLCSFLRTSQHEVNVRVTVGDESLHTVQAPAVFLLVVGRLQHHTLQVGTCIWLSKVHRHTLALANTWDVLLTLLL